MSRLESKNIQWGKSYVIGSNLEILKKQKAKDEAALIIENAKREAQKIIEEAENKKNEIIEEGHKQAEEIKNQAEPIRQEAQTIKQEAEDIKQQALDIVEQAKNEAEQLREQFRNEGIEKGRQEGHQQVLDEMQEKILMIDEFAKSAFEVKKRIIKNAHVGVIDLIISITKKIGFEALATDSSYIEKNLVEAINQLPEKEAVTILINPELASKICELLPDIKEKIALLENIKIVEDSSVAADGAIVEGLHGRVDARISSQINAIESELKSHLDSIPEADLVKMSEEEFADEYN